MTVHQRSILGASVALVLLLAASVSGAALPGTAVSQGGVARWAGLAAKECGIYGKRYAAVDAICYYPIDLDTPAGRHQIALWDQDGKQHLGFVQVEEGSFLEESIELPADRLRYVEVSAEDSVRATREAAEVANLLSGKGGLAQFSLPLGSPATPLPPGGEDFGSLRTFNGKHVSLHTGRDYPTSAGSPVKAVADGTVVLAADQFFSGNSVYIDHGAGFVSMSFHLASLAVKTGDVVRRGDTLGVVGDTGRATGPHLHLGLRWLGKRIDPATVLAGPNLLPSVGDLKPAVAKKAPAVAKKKSKRTAKPVDDEG